MLMCQIVVNHSIIEIHHKIYLWIYYISLCDKHTPVQAMHNNTIMVPDQISKNRRLSSEKAKKRCQMNEKRWQKDDNLWIFFWNSSIWILRDVVLLFVNRLPQKPSNESSCNFRSCLNSQGKNGFIHLEMCATKEFGTYFLMIHWGIDVCLSHRLTIIFCGRSRFCCGKRRSDTHRYWLITRYDFCVYLKNWNVKHKISRNYHKKTRVCVCKC